MRNISIGDFNAKSSNYFTGEGSITEAITSQLGLQQSVNVPFQNYGILKKQIQIISREPSIGFLKKGLSPT